MYIRKGAIFSLKKYYQLQSKYLLQVSRPEQFPYLARLTIRVAPGAGTIICGASFLQDRLSIVKLVIVVAIIQGKHPK